MFRRSRRDGRARWQPDSPARLLGTGRGLEPASGRRLVEHLASQLPGGGLLDTHPADRAGLRAQWRGADDDPVLSSAPGDLAVLRTLHPHLDGAAEPAAIGLFRDSSLGVE